MAEAGILPQHAGRSHRTTFASMSCQTALSASIIHSGSYRRLPEAYDALLRWVASNGYQVAAPIRELYLQNGMPVRQDDESYVTEIQVPVAKAS